MAKAPGLFPMSGISPPPDEKVRIGLKKVAEKAVEATWQTEEANPFGLAELRSRIQSMLAQRGFWCDLSTICVVSGSQQAIALIAQEEVGPGVGVGLPAMCYLPIKEVFAERGARLFSIRQDEQGIDLEQVKWACERGMSVLYAMPNCHYPTGASWSQETKERLLDLANRYRLTVIEDEYYGELYHTPRPPLALFSLASGRIGEERATVYYVSSFSTLLHPHFRLGFFVMPDGKRERFQRAKFLLDNATSLVSQHLLSRLWEEIDWPGYLEQKRRELTAAHSHMVECLKRWLPPGYHFQEVRMGVCAWVHAPASFDGHAFFERCLNEHLFVMPDWAFAVDQPTPGFQLRFGQMEPNLYEEGFKRLTRVASRFA